MRTMILLAVFCAIASAMSAMPPGLAGVEANYWRDSTWTWSGGDLAKPWSYFWRLAVTMPLTIEGQLRTITFVFPLSDSGKADTIWLPKE